MSTKHITTPEEFREVLRDVLETHKFMKVWPAKMDLDSLSKSLLGSGGIVLATKGDKWDSVIAGFLGPDLHSGELWGYEWLWLAGADAVPGHADLLRDTFEKVCKAQGCKRVVMGLFLGASRSDESLRMRYKKNGYRPLSESYIKTL
jgi:hypothetical protein